MMTVGPSFRWVPFDVIGHSPARAALWARCDEPGPRGETPGRTRTHALRLAAHFLYLLTANRRTRREFAKKVGGYLLRDLKKISYRSTCTVASYSVVESLSSRATERLEASPPPTISQDVL
jgi:hypothetical protein